MSVYDLIPEAREEGRTLGWHFCAVDNDENLVMRDGTVIPRGAEREWLPTCTVRMCESGYHASEDLRDALSYAPDGRALCLVELAGNIQRSDDKMCGATRRVLARIDVHPLLVQYARDSVSAINDSGVVDYARRLAAAIDAGDRATVEDLTRNEPGVDLDAPFFKFAAAVESAAMSELAAG